MRGLCSLSLFESNYIATMAQNGTFIFLGSLSSSIRFNQLTARWEWFDQKQVGSVATRKLIFFAKIRYFMKFSLSILSLKENLVFFSQSLEKTLLLGVNVFDFSKVMEDGCTSSLDSKLVKIKVTACGSGQYTCDDGECVSMDERCNQISNCRFKS